MGQLFEFAPSHPAACSRMAVLDPVRSAWWHAHPEGLSMECPGLKGTAGYVLGSAHRPTCSRVVSMPPANGDARERRGLDLRPSPCRRICRLPPVGAVAREGNEAAAWREAQTLK